VRSSPLASDDDPARQLREQPGWTAIDGEDQAVDAAHEEVADEIVFSLVVRNRGIANLERCSPLQLAER
jgi:hypothetical protein